MRSHASMRDVGERLGTRRSPALVTMISIGPSSLRTFAIASSTAAPVGDVDLHGRPHPAPVCRRSSAARRRRRRRRGRAARPGARSDARRRPTARPMPDAAPVTTATRLIVFPLGRARLGRVWPIPEFVRKQALEKRECHCHTCSPVVRVGRDASRREGGPGADRPHDRPGEGPVPRQGRAARRRRRGGRAGRLHVDLGARRSRTTSTR